MSFPCTQTCMLYVWTCVLTKCRSCLRVMLEYLQRAQSLLHTVSPPSTQHSEANWLLKVAWNLALKCSHHYKEMAEFFLTCYQLVSCLPVDSSVWRRQRTCQLMMAAATVQVARAADSEQEKVTMDLHRNNYLWSQGKGKGGEEGWELYPRLLTVRCHCNNVLIGSQ